MIRRATTLDLGGWIALRQRLWNDTPPHIHRAEAEAMLARQPETSLVLLHESETAQLRGFAEATLRGDHVNGCDTSPVAFLEGIFVDAAFRGAGVGRALIAGVRDWALAHGCTELASDAHIDNRESHAFHIASGFEETERVVFFRQRITTDPD